MASSSRPDAYAGGGNRGSNSNFSSSHAGGSGHYANADAAFAKFSPLSYESYQGRGPPPSNSTPATHAPWDTMSDCESLRSSRDWHTDGDGRSQHSRTNSNGSSNTSSRPTVIGHNGPPSSHSSGTINNSARLTPTAAAEMTSAAALGPASSKPRNRQDPDAPTSTAAFDLSGVPLTADGPAPDGTSTWAASDAAFSDWGSAMPSMPSVSNTIRSGNREDIVPWFFADASTGPDEGQVLDAGSPDAFDGSSYFSSESGRMPTSSSRHMASQSSMSLRPTTPPHQRTVSSASSSYGGGGGSSSNSSKTTPGNSSGRHPSLPPNTPSSSSKRMKNPFGFLRKKSFASAKDRNESSDANSSTASLAGSNADSTGGSGSGKKSSLSLHSKYSSLSSYKYSPEQTTLGFGPSASSSSSGTIGASHSAYSPASTTVSSGTTRNRSGSATSAIRPTQLPQYSSKASLRSTSASEYQSHGIDEEQANLDSGHQADGRDKPEKTASKKRRLPRPLTRDRDRSKTALAGTAGVGGVAGTAAIAAAVAGPHVSGVTGIGDDGHPSSDSSNLRTSSQRNNSQRGQSNPSDVEMTLDTNFDQIDDIVDTSLRHDPGPVGPKGEPLQDGLWSSVPSIGSASHQFDGSVSSQGRSHMSISTEGSLGAHSPGAPQFASRSTNGGSNSTSSGGVFTLQNAPSANRHTPYNGNAALASRPSDASGSHQTIDLNRPGLKKVSLAEAHRLARSDPLGRDGLGLNDADAPTGPRIAKEGWAQQMVDGPIDDPQDHRKGSLASRGSERSGVSPKTSAVHLPLHRTEPPETTQLWSKHGLTDPGYEFPPTPLPGAAAMSKTMSNSPLGGPPRKSSTGSTGANVAASTWMAPDSWAVQPDKVRDYLRDEEEEDNSTDGTNEADQTSRNKAGESRKSSALSSAAWSGGQSQQSTTSSTGVSPRNPHDSPASPPLASARSASNGDLDNLKRSSSVEVLASPHDVATDSTSLNTPTLSGRPAHSSRGGAFAVAGGAAAAAATKLGLHRHRQKTPSRPNTAGSGYPMPQSRPGTASYTYQAEDGNGEMSAGFTPSTGGSSLSQAKRPTLTSQSSQMGGLGRNYILRVDTPFGARTVSITLHTPTSDLRAMIARKSHPSGAIAYRLFVRDKGSERPLGESEMPAQLQKRRMEQAGYTEDDGLETLGREDHSYLLRFVYRPDSVPTFDSESFGNTEDIYTHLDLSGRNLEMVPIFLYRHADWIHSLDLSGNPMSDLPGDFIQLCTNLRTLRLSNLALKRIPQSLRYSTSLTHLDLSNNRIPDLSHIALDQVAQLRSLRVQNNRLTELPSYFGRLTALKHLSISNNRFEVFPSIICEIAGLTDLDISFNSIGSLPANLGDLKQLESLILVGNSIEKLPSGIVKLSSLRKIDVRRNLLQDVSALFQLETLGEAQCEHNSIKAFDATFGPNLRSLNLGHNPMSKLILGTSARSQLVSLDLSAANLSRLDETLVSQLSSLYDLILDRNQFVSLPDSLGELHELRLLSVTNNHLAALPDSIGKLTNLRRLLVHNNNLKSLPNSIWNCGSLTSINASSNLLEFFPLPPLSSDPPRTAPIAKPVSTSNHILPTLEPARKGSATSLNPVPGTPTTASARPTLPLSTSLRKLRLGDNRITQAVFGVLALLTEVEILNLSFNDIFEVPNMSLAKLPLLRELYLSGNNLSNLPTDDLVQLKLLRILHINANRLQTLPAEIGSLTNLANLDVGNNNLKYNIANWHYDWNWNSNPELRYLNLSGNKRLEIKSKMSGITGAGRKMDMSDFQRLSSLRVLGLMDVTVLLQQMPDEHDNRRVRTSLSQINDMGYGCSDALGRFDNLSLVDVIVPNFRKRSKECLIGLFEGRGHGSHVGSRIAKHLADWIKHRIEREVIDATQYQEASSENVSPSNHLMPDILRRAFLKLQQEYALLLMSEGNRKLSEAKAVAATDERKSSAPAVAASTTRSQWQAGASAALLYVIDKTLYVANAGDTLAVLSRGGTADHITTRHEPFDREETLRIRSAEGWVSLRGYVNDSLDVSRSFGYYHLTPFVNASPAIRSVQLNDSDEFVIVASRALWDQMSYQTAVDIARTERGDLMIAAQKLRDFAIAYGAEESIMVMVVAVGDLFESRRKTGADGDVGTDAFKDAYRKDRADLPGDRTLARLEREVAPPIGHVALVFTDIKNSTKLWETNGGMQSAMRLHNVLLRRQLRAVGGYEVKTEGDAFMVSFPSVTSALLWCFNVQLHLLKEDWPQEILESEDGAEVLDSDGTVIHRGLSVRMGIHWGWPVCETDPITRRMDYFGPMVNRASRISGAADGGQIMASRDVINELTSVLGTFDEAGGPACLLGEGGGGVAAAAAAAQDESTGLASSAGADFDEETFRLLHPNVTRDVVLLRRMGFGISEVGERRLKGLETPELLHLVYPRGLASRLAPRADAPAPQVFEPTPSLLDIEEIKALGMICLRLESLSNAKLFPGIFVESDAATSGGGGEGDAGGAAAAGPSAVSPTPPSPTSLTTTAAAPSVLPTTVLAPATSRQRAVEQYIGLKPELLIVSMRDDAPDDELANLLEQLVVRTCNALAVIMLRHQLTVRAGGTPGVSLEAIAALVGPLQDLLQL